MMTTSDAGIQLIKKYEGCCLDAYLCPAKVPTIGYGHTEGVKLGMRITQEQADSLLKGDLVSREAAVRRLVRVPVTQGQFDALVSFVYNIGTGAFEKSTLLKKLNAGDTRGASAQFAVWNKAGGKELPGLTKRRAAERALFDGH